MKNKTKGILYMGSLALIIEILFLILAYLTNTFRIYFLLHTVLLVLLIVGMIIDFFISKAVYYFEKDD